MTQFKASSIHALLEVDQKTPESRCTVLAVADIDEDPVNNTIYEEHEEEDLLLMQDIQLHGLMQPLAVRRHPKMANRYIVVAGHRRLKALRRLGVAWAECYIHACTEAGDDILSQLALISTNSKQRERSPSERAQEIRRVETLWQELKQKQPERYREIQERLGLTAQRDMTAQVLGISPRTVTYHHNVEKHLTDEEKALLDRAELSSREVQSIIQERRESQRQVEDTARDRVQEQAIKRLLQLEPYGQHLSILQRYGALNKGVWAKLLREILSADVMPRAEHVALSLLDSRQIHQLLKEVSERGAAMAGI